MNELLALVQDVVAQTATTVQTTSTTQGVSDLVWQAGIAAFATMVIAFLHYRQAVTLARIQKTGEDAHKTGVDTHVLVNKNYGIQLKLIETALRRLAVATKDSADIAAADEAGRLYDEHMARQAVVDATNR